MEDTLREDTKYVYDRCLVGLNPCFNGRYSQREECLVGKDTLTSLNPCFNGRYSQRWRCFKKANLVRS